MRLPKQSPVIALHLRADNDSNGNPRRCFVLLNRRGEFVEALDEGYKGTGELFARWPWLNWTGCQRLGLEQSYGPESIDVSVSEYRRQLRREPWEGTEKLRRLADRIQASR